MQSVANIVQLRQLLAERFPNVRTRLSRPEKSIAYWPSGISQLDAVLDGGLPRSALTELVSPKLSGGSGLVARALLQQAAQHRQWSALVDGTDSFDPSDFENSELSRLLWVRCQNAAQAVKAADFLLRDGNLSLVLLDLRLNPAKQLQKIPASSWYRLQRCLEPIATALLIITPRAMVGAAHARVQLQGRFALDAVSQPDHELLAQLTFELLRMHGLENQNLLAQAS